MKARRRMLVGAPFMDINAFNKRQGINYDDGVSNAFDALEFAVLSARREWKSLGPRRRKVAIEQVHIRAIDLKRCMFRSDRNAK
jgi:hypothetical protein